MEYKITENSKPIFYSTITGTTEWPYCLTHGTQIKEPPIERLHYHSVPEIGIFVQGSGECYVGNKVYRFKAVDIQIIRPFVPHYAVSDPGVTTRMVFFTFNAVKLMQCAGMSNPENELLIKNIKIPFNGIFAPNEYPAITDHVKRIIERCETSDDFTDMAVAFNIGDFLITCQKYQHISNLFHEEELRENAYHRISPAINRINTNLYDSSRVAEAELARVCAMSVSNFRRVFKLETGLSPKAYITKARMDYAEYLLKNTNITITEIAEKLGYNAVCGFNKIFSSVFGISPSGYRKKYK